MRSAPPTLPKSVRVTHDVEAIKSGKADVLITSVAKLPDSETVNTYFPDVLIFDEAHYLKPL